MALYRIKPLAWEYHELSQTVKAWMAIIPSMAVYTIELNVVAQAWHVYFNNGYSVATIGVKDTQEEAKQFASEHWKKHLENTLEELKL